MTLYNTDGAYNVSVVDGTVHTGVQAPDGSYYVYKVDGTTNTGLYHPCGAYNVFLSTGNTGWYHPCGAMNVSVSPYTYNTVSVNVVSGSLTPPVGTLGSPMGLLLSLTYAS